MRKVIFLSLILLTWLVWDYKNIKKEFIANVRTVRNSKESKQSLNYKTLQYNGRSYAYMFFKVEELANLELILNSEKESFRSLVSNNNCVAAINAGFYDALDKPLGLWFANGLLLSNVAEDSALLNGFFNVSRDGLAHIDSDISEEANFQLALQSGPLLYNDGTPLPLKLITDKNSRRSLVLVSDKGVVYFVTVFDPQSVFSGPFLVDLPAVLQVFAEAENITPLSALNLDGGFASAFFDGENNLPEFKGVGGAICQTK